MNGTPSKKSEFSKLGKKPSTYRKEDPRMHKTKTVDYSVVCDGEI
jgi:hypothetical protein